MRTLQNYIDGKWVDSRDARTLVLVNPTTEEAHVMIPSGGPEDVDLAVAAAKDATETWSSLPLRERLDVLEGIANSLEANVSQLARLEYEEMGKPVAVAEEFLAAGIEVLRASINDARDYAFVEEVTNFDGIRTITVRRPLGVVAQIIPWNFTVTAALLGLGPLLAAGNTVVLKPSEKASLSAVKMLELINVPAGVLNMVLGDSRAGIPLAEHPDIELVHFTGSVNAGRSVARASADKLKRAVLELGGKDPVIVDADVDVDRVAAAVAYAAFINSGQICTSMERIYVHRDIAAEFIAALVNEARSYTMGDGVDPLVRVGPLVDESQRRTVQRHIADAVEKGAEVLIGGEAPDRVGFFFPPTVLAGVTSGMLIMTEETFGPVAPVQVVSSFDDALRLAAESSYGLAATIYTEDPRKAQAATRLPVGMVWINHWQGGGLVRMYEPARSSGSGATGCRAALDAATRAVSISHDLPFPRGSELSAESAGAHGPSATTQIIWCRVPRKRLLPRRPRWHGPRTSRRSKSLCQRPSPTV
ncbi:MAG TPA: aldehyde dehydrogenase family protein [Mycobacterium sp.]